VSIKKKFATAVATASLLAGLFGSAFVPVANAAATATASFTAAAVTASVAALTGSNEDYTDTTGKIAYYSAAVYPVFVVEIDFAVDEADNGTYAVEVSGGTVRGCVADITDDGNDAGDTSTATFGSLVSTSSGCTVQVTSSIAADDLYIQLTLNKLSAGSSATFTVTDPDGDSLTIANANKATGVASTALASVVDAAESADTVDMNSNGNGTKGEAADVADETISSVDYWLPDQSLKKAAWAGVVSNGYGTAVAATTSLIAEVSNDDFAVGCDDTVSGAAATSNATIQQFNSSAAGVWECQVHSDGSDSAGGTFTLTVRTSITGAVVGTVSGAFYGEVQSITASLVAGDRAPEVAGADVDDFIALVVKDGNGKAYGLAETNALTITGYGTVAGGTTAGAEDMVDGTSAATKNYFKLDDDFCPASSTGKTASVQAAIVNATGTSIKSNTLTVNCAAAAGDDLTVQKIEFSKSNPLPGETFDVYIYMEDADGVLAGSGDTDSADFTLTLAGGSVATDYAAAWDGPGTTIDVSELKYDGNGRYTIGIKAPTTVGTVISVNDPASSVLAKVYTTNDAYEGVLSVGPKKLKATADFGPAAAKKKIAFVLESAAGVTKTYYRRANASGVATFTLVLKGTWTVYATFGDEISDTGELTKK